MSTSLREQIMTKVKARLLKVLVANGYRTDAGKHVHYGQSMESVPRVVPVIYFCDGNEAFAPEWGPNSRRIAVTMEAYLKTRDAEMPGVANQILADIDTAIYLDEVSGNVDWAFAGLVQKIQFQQSRLLILPTEVPMTGVASEYLLVYRQILGDPYQG